MRIIHTADWHSGLVSWRGSKVTNRTDEIRNVLESFVEQVRRLNPDVVLVAGDLIHYKRNPNLESIRTVLDALENLAKISPVVVVAGNHDWEGIVTYDRISKDIIVVGHGDYNLRMIDTNSGRIALYPVPYVSGKMMLSKGKEGVLKSLIGLLRKFDADNPNADYKVLVSHAMFRGIARPFEDVVSIELEKEYIGSSFHYVALGHVHAFQEVIKNPKTYYSGSIIQVDFSESEDKGFLVVDVDGWNVDVKFSKLPHKILRTVDLVNEERERIISRLEEKMERADYLRVILSGKNADLTEKLMKMEKVVNVKIEEEDRDFTPQIETFENIREVLFEYVKKQLEKSFPSSKVEKAIEILNEAFEKASIDDTMA